MKPTIEEWAKDCEKLGRLAKRMGYAVNYLTTEEIIDADSELNTATLEFVGKYAVPQDYARSLANTVCDSVRLEGLGRDR